MPSGAILHILPDSPANLILASIANSFLSPMQSKYGAIVAQIYRAFNPLVISGEWSNCSRRRLWVSFGSIPRVQLCTECSVRRFYIGRELFYKQDCRRASEILIAHESPPARSESRHYSRPWTCPTSCYRQVYQRKQKEEERNIRI